MGGTEGRKEEARGKRRGIEEWRRDEVKEEEIKEQEEG